MTRRRSRGGIVMVRGVIGHRAAVAISLIALGMAVAACASGPSVPGVASIRSAAPSHAQPKTAKYPHSGLGLALCMRAHGITDFPEPSAAGGIVIGVKRGSRSDLDPGNPRFRAALRACSSVLGLTPPSPAQQAAQLARALRFAVCMRAHGVTNFPDPGAAGSFTIDGASGGLNPSDPTFQSASKACTPRVVLKTRR